jgi:hypothetical protein
MSFLERKQNRNNRRVVADAAALFVLQKVDKCATAQ